MPDQIVSRVLFRAAVAGLAVVAIHLGRQLPAASSDATRELRTGRPQTFSYLVLLRMGFTKLSRSPGKLVSSYLAFSPLPAMQAVYFLWHFP